MYHRSNLTPTTTGYLEAIAALTSYIEVAPVQLTLLQSCGTQLGKSGCRSLASNTTKHYGTPVRRCNNHCLSWGDDEPFGLASVHS